MIPALRSAVLRDRRLRYTVVSALTFGSSEGILFGSQVLFHLHPLEANLSAWAIGTWLCYSLNRRYVWRCQGRTRWLSELVPFWVYAGLSLGLTSAVLGATDQSLKQGTVLDAAVVNAVATGCAVIAWIGRYFLLDRLVFRRIAQPLAGPATQGAQSLEGV